METNTILLIVVVVIVGVSALVAVLSRVPVNITWQGGGDEPGAVEGTVEASTPGEIEIDALNREAEAEEIMATEARLRLAAINRRNRATARRDDAERQERRLSPDQPVEPDD